MSLLKRVGWRRGALALAVATLLIVVATQTLSDEPEIALLIGEPWENMRKRSTAAIDPAIAGHFGGVCLSRTLAFVSSILSMGS